MTDPDCALAAKSSPRSPARLITLGALIALTVWIVQNPAVHFPNLSSRSPLLRVIDASNMQPSAFDEESDMSPAQLLNRWDASITQASKRFHVPKAWIRAVMAQESGGRTMLGEGRPIVSRAGAVGLMQVMPATYREMAAEHRLGANPFNARDNILAGTAYLRWLHRKYGFPKMFAAYNAGPGRVEQGGILPAETRAYVGGIARNLKLAGRVDLVPFTRPDGLTVKIDPARITALRPVRPGEYAKTVRSVVILGKHKRQGIREDVAVATAAIRGMGGTI